MSYNDDPAEQLCEREIKNCRDRVEYHIRNARRAVRYRLLVAGSIGAFELFAAGVSFYFLHYGMGIMYSIMALFFAATNWWAWTKSVKNHRYAKRAFAWHEREFKKILAEYRENKWR